MEGLDQYSVREGKSNKQHIGLGTGPDPNSNLFFKIVKQETY